MGKWTVTVGNFNTPLSRIYKFTGWKISKEDIVNKNKCKSKATSG